MIIGFNHNYYLRHDYKRSILAANPKAVEKGIVKEWMSRIHPIYSMLFALLSIPQERSLAEQRISDFFGISSFQAQNLLNQFLEKDGILASDYENTSSYFPESIIKQYKDSEYLDYIKNKTTDSTFTTYNPADFKFSDINIDARRMFRCPHGLVFIITTKCATNCIYCYADKVTNGKSTLSIEEIKRILKDAFTLGIREIQMIGGEFFLHPNWKEILSISTNLGFTLPLLSTKMPLSTEQLDYFRKFNLRLQFSLDSISKNILKHSIGVSEQYCEKILKSIEYADKLNIKYQISTVLTKHTATIENLTSLYKVFKGLKNMSRWSIRMAFRSLYTSQSFEEIKVTTKQYSQLHSWYNNLKLSSNHFNIEFPESFTTEYQYAKDGSKSFNGAQCSANMSHMVILPNGDVTICEQLYWNHRFIIGNILKNTIEQIWNSDKAISLFSWQQKNIRPESACSTCSIYDSCRSFSNKCIVNTIKAYGDENWDFPDPRCIYAPSFKHEIT